MPMGISSAINLSLKLGPFFQEKLTEETEIETFKNGCTYIHTEKTVSKYLLASLLPKTLQQELLN